jgi:hypothetical protein
MAIAAKKFLVDIESDDFDPSNPFVRAIEIVEAGQAFDLGWVDPSYAEADEHAVLADFERTRRFKHAGSAIAWARRQLFHGRVYGEQIEMHVRRLYTANGKPAEEDMSLVDITLAGFRNGTSATP